MSGDILDLTPPSIRDGSPKRPEELPHGFLPIPAAVRDLVAREEAKFPPERFTQEVRERLWNEWTLQYYFDDHGHEVAYRPTANGPDVQAVGDVERMDLRGRIGEDAFRKLESWMP